MAVKESVVRDHFAARYARAWTEVRTKFGRIDVVTDDFVIEVEPFTTWRHGVRQALAYAQETGKRPALAVYGEMTPSDGARLWDDCSGLVTLFMLNGQRWERIQRRGQAVKPWAAPPPFLEPRERRWRTSRVPKDPRTDDELRRAAAAAMDRATRRLVAAP